MREANKVLYTQNRFIVRSHCLSEFLRDEALGTDGQPCNVNKLIRKIVVRVDTEHYYDTDFDPATPEEQGKSQGEEVDPWAVFDLTSLLAVENPEHVVIEIYGGGPANGLDLLTQLKIKEISLIVQQIISRFGSKLEIRKARSKLSTAFDPSNVSGIFDLRHYDFPKKSHSNSRFAIVLDATNTSDIPKL